MKSTVLAGLLGGIAMFAWASVAHMVLPVSNTGISEIPGEAPVLAAMQSAMGSASGMYIFPGLGLGPQATMQERNAAMQAYDQKLAVTPSGILIYHPPGVRSLTPGQMVTEFLTEALEALIVVFLLAQTRISTFAGRVAFFTAAGVLASLGTNLSYWNWYGFPGSYTAAYMAIQILEFVAAGLVAAALLRKQPRAA
jgi:hypothetical protein